MELQLLIGGKMENKDLMARVGDKNITKQDVLDFINSMNADKNQFMTDEGMKVIADEMINQELLYLDAKDCKYDEEDDFKREVQLSIEQMLKNYAIHKLFNKVEVSDEEVEKYYRENQSKIKPSYQYRASHILLDSENKANEVKELLKERKFEDLAKEFSSCPSAEKGGDLGTFRSGQMVKEFDEALENMEENTITGPVKTQFGYHIIKLGEKKLLQAPSLDQMREQLRQQLIAMKQQELYVNKTNELKKNYEIKKYY